MKHNSCPYIAKCPILPHLQDDKVHFYPDIYCHGNFQDCKRFQLNQTCETIPLNLMPYGGFLWGKKKPSENP